MSDDFSSVTGDFSSSSDDYVPETSGRGYKLSRPSVPKDEARNTPNTPKLQPAPAPAPQPAAQPAGTSPTSGAYDQRGQGKAAADRMAREQSKHPPKVDPAALEARIKDLEQKLATQGSRTVQDNGGMLSTRPEVQRNMRRMLGTSDGFPMMFLIPATILGPP